VYLGRGRSNTPATPVYASPGAARRPRRSPAGPPARRPGRRRDRDRGNARLRRANRAWPAS